MITEADIALSKEEISAKFPKGSPDYPGHAKGCGCSGCFASWLEWRSAHAAYELGFTAGSLRKSRNDAAFIRGFLTGVSDMLRMGHDHPSANYALRQANITRSIAKRAGVPECDLVEAWPPSAPESERPKGASK